ncbi:MAG TPA: ABC transporter permease [Stellaceae bacterium]|nr:ABC transporter permease [Stellaceae bacterium]
MTPRSARVQQVATLIVVLAVWEGAARLGWLPKIVLPAPSAIAGRLFDLFASGLIWPHLWATTASILSGFGLGVAAGFAFGALVALVPAFERLVYPYMVALQTVPKIAIAPLFILWFGYGLMSKVVIAALVCFFPVLVSVMSAFHTTDREQLDMMRACGASRWQIFIHLRIRAALPTIFNGLEIATVFAVIGAVVGEFVGAQAGLGYLITTLNFNLDVPGVFAVLIVLSLLGIILHAIVRGIGRRLVFWIRSERPELLT